MTTEKIQHVLNSLDHPADPVKIQLDTIASQLYGTLYGNLELREQTEIKDQLFFILIQN